jgi:hypothetical protein
MVRGHFGAFLHGFKFADSCVGGVCAFFWYDCYCFRERACYLDCSRSVVSSVIKVMEVPLYPLLACYASVPSKPLLSSEGSLPKRV